jgi:hypothetical protein
MSTQMKIRILHQQLNVFLKHPSNGRRKGAEPSGNSQVSVRITALNTISACRSIQNFPTLQHLPLHTFS